jgi:GMP reductase
MLGGMLAGHTECSGEIIEENGQKYKLFYGMSSKLAVEKHAGGFIYFFFLFSSCFYYYY